MSSRPNAYVHNPQAPLFLLTREQTPETEHLPRKQRIPDESRMVKAYARSAAGMDVELVSEIRSPATCLKTIDYLMKRLDDDEFDFLHSWIWDRTRAIRKDLRTQRIEQRSDINILLTCLERSARFLILSTHQMARTQKEDYSHQQDIEQLNQTLMSLKERYVDNRRVGYPSENEPEFWAYRLILAPLFTNTQFENELHRLPSDLRNNPRVRTAIEIYRSLKSVIFTKTSSFVQAQANWKRFWELIKSPSVSYLMACAAEVSFQRVRHVVLDALWRVYRMGSTSRPKTVDTWTVDKVKEVLGLDRDEEAIQLCQAYGFEFNSINGGPAFLDVTAKGFARTPLPLAADLSPQIFSQGIVEKKRHDRAFSAVVQAMSVQQARNHGLLAKSERGAMDDETSLFVPEASAAQSNIFMQPKSGFSAASTLNPTTNPFKPNTPSGPSPGVATTNPFLKKPDGPTPDAAPPNPFAPKPLPTTQGFLGSSTGVFQPGLFDATKNPVKFASPGTDAALSASASKPNLFMPKPTLTLANPPVTAADGPSLPSFSFFSQGTKTEPQQAATTAPTANTSSFVFPPFAVGGDKIQSDSSALSFTPAGSPAPAAPTTHSAENQEAEEAARQRKAEAEAEVERQRARDEQARQAREAAERQRIEAERQLRWQEEERNRLAREHQMREEEARRARLQARESGYDSLAADLMFDAEEGLMMQFVENLIVNTAGQVMAAAEEDKRRKLWEKRQALADAMYQQRVLGLKRLVMASWIAKIEKKKRAQQARDRRKRLKEQRAKMVNGEDTVIDMPIPVDSQTKLDQVNDTAFRKPQAPASARRAKRTEQRRGTPSSVPKGESDFTPRSSKSGQHTVAQTALTPVSMSSSRVSNGGYSEAYQKSNAPIDRTDTDYFAMRAEGLDPSRLRKRSFDSSSEEDQPEVEPKRPRISPPITQQHSVPLSASTTSDRRARLDAIEQRFRKSEGSPQATIGATSFHGRSSLSKRSSVLIEQARQVLSRSRSTKTSPTQVQHDYGRSVPHLHRRASSLQQSMLGKSISTAATNARAAYWNRSSRFVPKPVYGQGPDAIRAYREKYGLSSPANSRPTSTEPLAISSPIPSPQSYMPVNGYTQEQYTKEYSDEEEDDEEEEEEEEDDEEEDESSGVEVVDVDAEDDDIVTTEDDYEGDEESDEQEEEDEEEDDQEGDSPMQDGEVGGFTNGRVTSHYAPVYGNFKDYTHVNAHQFAQPPSAKQQLDSHNQPAGKTQDDAIELSD
jgi:hypothetical protein